MLIRSAVSAASTDYVGTGGLQRRKRREAMAGCTQKKCSRCNNKHIRTREEERPNDRSAKSDQQRNNKLIHIHHFFFNGPLSFPSSDSVVAALNCRGMETPLFSSVQVDDSSAVFEFFPPIFLSWPEVHGKLVSFA